MFFTLNVTFKQMLNSPLIVLKRTRFVNVYQNIMVIDSELIIQN